MNTKQRKSKFSIFILQRQPIEMWIYDFFFGRLNCTGNRLKGKRFVKNDGPVSLCAVEHIFDRIEWERELRKRIFNVTQSDLIQAIWFEKLFTFLYVDLFNFIFSSTKQSRNCNFLEYPVHTTMNVPM